jgi:hypothetical protein
VNMPSVLRKNYMKQPKVIGNNLLECASSNESRLTFRR